MPKIKSFEELKKIKESVQDKLNLREKGENIEEMVRIGVGMATCGIASGARETMSFFAEELKNQNIDNAVITQTGCMGYCHSEPTVEVRIPGKEAVVFGNVNSKERVEEIVKTYIKNGELVDGIIPVTHKSVDD